MLFIKHYIAGGSTSTHVRSLQIYNYFVVVIIYRLNILNVLSLK